MSKNKFMGSPRNPLIFYSVFLFIFSLLPLIKINNQNYSLLKFIADGAFSFAAAVPGFLLAILLLFKKDINFDYASGILYFLSYISLWLGFLKYIPEKGNTLFGFLILILPIANTAFYLLVISTRVQDAARVWPIWRFLNSIDSNSLLIAAAARKFNLAFTEGHGAATTSASGIIRGYHVTISEQIYITLGYRYPYTEISVDSKGIDFPLAILSARQLAAHPAIPDEYYREQKRIQFRLLKFEINLPVHTSGRLKIYTQERNLALYSGLGTEQPELEKILSRKARLNFNFPNIILFRGSKVSFITDYSFLGTLFGYSFTAADAPSVINTLINLAERYQK